MIASVMCRYKFIETYCSPRAEVKTYTCRYTVTVILKKKNSQVGKT